MLRPPTVIAEDVGGFTRRVNASAASRGWARRRTCGNASARAAQDVADPGAPHIRADRESLPVASRVEEVAGRSAEAFDAHRRSGSVASGLSPTVEPTACIVAPQDTDAA